MRGKSSKTSKLLGRIKRVQQKARVQKTAKATVQAVSKKETKKSAIKKIVSATSLKVKNALTRLSRPVTIVSAAKKAAALKVLAKTAAKPKVAAPVVTIAEDVIDTKVQERPVSRRNIADEAKYDLPWKYNDDRIVILPRDPWWIFTYWDITQGRIDGVVNNIPDDERYGLKWVLRVHDVTGVKDFTGVNSVTYFDIDIYFDARSWYLNTDKPGRGWCVEIGFLSHKGRFYMVARSNIINSPRFGISSNIDEEWALPDEEYFKLLGMYDLSGRSSMSMKRRFEEVVKQQISSQMASWNLSSMTSPMGGMGGEADQFFLEVWTELILHGRTHADATVTVEGKKVNLRPDGTFTLRYALPVGDYKYEVTGVSKNRKHKITKTPAVKRFEK